MGVNYQHLKRYQNFFGIDLKSNDLEYPEKYAQDATNFVISPTGTLEKRVGYQVAAPIGAKYGLFQYNRVDENGLEQPEILGCSNTISKLSKVTLTVTYGGSAATASLKVVYDSATSVYRCVITEGNSTVLDYSLGLGRDSGSPVTVSTLKTQIDALTGFTTSLSGSSSAVAAFIKTIPETDLKTGAVTLQTFVWSSVNVCPQTGKTGPLVGSETNQYSSDFENVTAVQLQNCIYLSNGYDAVIKYDGQNVYRAGLPPKLGDTSYAISASGYGGGGAHLYVWRQQFVQIDHNGNRIEGNTVDSIEYDSIKEPSVDDVSVSLQNIQAGTGFNTNCAIVAGAQTTVTTITVDDGSGGSHTMKAGDTAYFYDGVSSSYVERKVTSVAATTITIAGAAVTVADNAVISNNLRIKVLRNKNTGITPTLYFELVELPNNSFSATQTYVDSKADASLSIEFVEPVTDRSPPVNGKYVSAYQGLMVTAGDLTQPNQVSVSDIENCEYFPLGENQFTVNNIQGDKITGIHPSSESFIVFQNRGVHAITGDVPNKNFRVDALTYDVGCIAHATIADVRGAICFLSSVGPRFIQSSSIPKGLGAAKDNELNSRIDPLVYQRGVTAEQTYALKRAVAMNDRKGERYLLFIPAESTGGGERWTNANSVMMAYDYTRDAWHRWTNLDATGGMLSTDSDTEIYFVERRNSGTSASPSVKRYLYRFNNSATFLDYCDFNQAISVVYKSPWEFLGETGQLKNFQRLRVYSSELLDAPFTLEVETERDFIAETPVSLFTLTFGSNGWGQSSWGINSWGDPATTFDKHKLSNGRCVSLRVVMRNSEIQTNVAITGYELEMSLAYKPGFKE